MGLLLHPTRATRDLPRAGIHKGDRMFHLLSDRLGVDGEDELRLFVSHYGLQTEWVQYPHSYREHFDVHGAVAERMRLDGARVVTNHEIGRLLRAKRSHLVCGPTM